MEALPLEAPTDVLPPTVRRLLTLVDRDVVARLLAEGGRIYVPPQPTAEHRLTKLVGMKAATLLAEHFGADWLEIPRCVGAERTQRNDFIRAQVAAGVSRTSLAERFELTLRQLRRIVG